MRAISRAIVAHSSSRLSGLFRVINCSSSHFSNSYLIVSVSNQRRPPDRGESRGILRKSKVRLYDNIQSTSSHKAARDGCQAVATPSGEFRDTYYARGNDSPCDLITSAMQMVADLETPTRQ
jgi:hypothetical protein